MLSSFERTWQCPKIKVGMTDGSELIGHGELLQDPIGLVTIRVSISQFLVATTLFVEDQIIEGETSEGELFRAEHCSINNLESSSFGHSVVCFVPREVCIRKPATEETWSELCVYLKNARIPLPVAFSEGSRQIQMASLGFDDKDGRPGLVRSQLRIKEGTLTNSSGESILREVITLLSLAQRCWIYSARQEFRRNDEIVKTLLVSNPLPGQVTKPLIGWLPSDMSSFFTQTLPAFRNNQFKYALLDLMWYYCLAYTDPNLRVNFILASVFMEAFKYNWARNVSGLKQKYNTNGSIRGFVKTQNRNGDDVLYGFKELLEKASMQLGYTSIFTFTENRNALFHTGASIITQGNVGNDSLLIPELYNLYKQMDDIILRILAYQGPIYSYDEPNLRIDFPSRTYLP